MASTAGRTPITWSVTALDGTPTTLATIDGSGLLTAVATGSVLVVATVAADDTYNTATISQEVEISLRPAELIFTSSPAHLLTNHTTRFTAAWSGGGAITWSIVESDPAATINGDGLVTAGATPETITVQAVVAETPTYTGETLTATLDVITDVDTDDDGLIEIHDLTMLHNIRYNVSGRSYKSSADAVGITSGCPDATPDNGVANENCIGYELVSDLDFDKDGDGSTWSGDSTNGYHLDSGDRQAPYFLNRGWEPLPGRTAFASPPIIEGNGFVIRNMAMIWSYISAGFFNEFRGTIRNLGLENALVVDHNDVHGEANIGILTGEMQGGTIIASHVSGVADSGDGRNKNNNVGGLAGKSQNSTIIASYATTTLYGGPGSGDKVGSLVGENSGGTITASYARGAVDGGGGNNDRVGGLVGENNAGGSITASYATGTVDGGDGNNGRVGGLVGEQISGRITASYASGSADGGDGRADNVGGLVGFFQDGTITATYATVSVDGGDGMADSAGSLVGAIQSDSSTITFSYGFGPKAGDENIGIDRAPSTHTVASAVALTADNVGDTAWNSGDSNTLNAWDFGDGNQPPALLYNDYDGLSTGTDYCTRFERVNIQCDTLIPGQRATTTPRFSTHTDAIQLAEGDIATRVTANILLPTTFTIDGTPLEIMWSVHHDPEGNMANKVTVGAGSILRVDDSSRTSTRRVILRATTGMGDDATLVNDYRLHIIAGSGGLQNPGLRFTETVDILLLPSDTTTHDFGATSDSDGAISYQVSDPALASIDASGQLTATAIGTVEVIARVAASGTWRGATTTHRLAILSPVNIALTPSTLVDILGIGTIHDFGATHDSSAAITWSVTNPDNADSVRATIDPASGRLTALGTGTVRVTATVAATATHARAATSHTLTILSSSNLAFNATVDTLQAGAMYTFIATRSGSGAITWEVTDGDGAATDLATIDAASGQLTAAVVGTVMVTARVAATVTHGPATISHTLEITPIPTTLTLTSTPAADTLAVMGTHTFTAMTDVADDTRPITWSVTDTGDAATDRADIGATTGLLTARKPGMIKVTATVAADRVYATATTSYTFTIARLPSTLALTTTADTLAINSAFTFEATSLNSGTITWGVTNIGGSGSARATIDRNSGRLTAVAIGSVAVTATVVADDIYLGATISHALEITSIPTTLTLTSPPNTLAARGTHTFAATTDVTDDDRPITWSVTAPDNGDTTLAAINPSTGALTANGVGMIKVTATVAAAGLYSGDTASHDLEITPITSTLTLSLAGGGNLPDTLMVEGELDFDASASDSMDSREITWSVTGTDDRSTTLATINPSTGVLTANGVGQIKVTATVAADTIYSGHEASHPLTINRRTTTLTFGAYSRSISRHDDPVTLTLTTNSEGEITWSGSDDGVATITSVSGNDRSATLTPVAAGVLTVTASLAQTATHTAISVTSDEITINNLVAPNLTLTGSPPVTLAVNATHDFAATHLGTGALTWSVTHPDGSNTDRASIVADTGVLTASKGGAVQVVATVAPTTTHSGATVSHDLEITRLANTLTLTTPRGRCPADHPGGQRHPRLCRHPPGHRRDHLERHRHRRQEYRPGHHQPHQRSAHRPQGRRGEGGRYRGPG